MNDILFGNNNQTVIRRIARKNLTSNRSRNIFLVLAIFMTTFMTAAILNLCVNQIEMQYLYSTNYLGAADNEIEPVIYVLVMMVAALMVAAFLLIYNVMSVSVAREIRFYGLLGTIGMSGKQIRRMILWQVMRLCIIGIPFGLLFSVFVSQAVVPMFLSMYPQYLAAGYPIRFHPLIFAAAALFAFLTAIAGALKPAQRAAKVSPIEAVRFLEFGFSGKNMRTSVYSSWKMAWRNVFRVPKRTMLVFCSLFLGMTLFMAVSVILGSASADTFAKTAAVHTKGDIYLRNGMSAQYNFGVENRLSVFETEFMDQLNELPGLTEMNVSYFHEIRMDITDKEGEISRLPGYVYGVGAKGIAELNKELEKPIDEAAFRQGEFVIIRDIWREPQTFTDSVTFFPEADEKTVSFTLGGVLPSEFLDYFGTGYNRLPCVYMSDELLKELVSEPAIYDIELNIERNQQNQALSMVRELVAGNGNINLQSEIAVRQEAENIVSTLKVIGNSISVILWLIGILNFTNVITTSILWRRHELALLESVGQSAGQSKKMLVYEGLIFACLTLLLVGVFGSTMIFGLFRAMKEQFAYMEFTFPFVSCFIMVILMFGVCLGVPRVAYPFISRRSVVERLKQIDF